jgi:hypothetical protein
LLCVRRARNPGVPDHSAEGGVKNDATSIASHGN